MSTPDIDRCVLHKADAMYGSVLSQRARDLNKPVVWEGDSKKGGHIELTVFPNGTSYGKYSRPGRVEVGWANPPKR